MLALIILNLPAMLCLGFSWKFAMRPQIGGFRQDWRRSVCFYGLIAATLGLALDLAFLAHGYTENPYFLGPPIGVWLIVGRTNGVVWVLSVLAAALGRGKARLPLFLYCLTSLAGNLLFIMTTTVD